MSKIIKVKLARLSVCPCGFTTLQDEITLGTEYEIDDDLHDSADYICGKCHQRQPMDWVMVMPREKGQRRGWLPRALFDPPYVKGACESKREENAREKLQELARAIDEELPQNWGFFLMVFPFGEEPGRMNYISNGKRQDVVRLMKEFLAKQNEKNWMTHA